MIIATGIDIIEIGRFQKTLERYDRLFLDHIFTPEEQAAAPTSARARVTYFAARWAVKEAVSKVLGTGIGEHCAWTDILVQRSPLGKPSVTLTGKAAITAKKLGIAAVHVSISHEQHYACAVAIGESS
ncbi:MAG TPA: holo-ACP synthase [Lentisphaeria bacterium]|nr:holo-ACP synthase [Lentisphaeria bacterium]